MLRSVWLACVLMVAPATGLAQSGPQPAVVDKAQTTATSATQKLTQLSTQRAQLQRKYTEQLTAVEGLKKQKPSWRRDRELNTAQANANDTAKKLTAIDKQIASAQQTVTSARKTVVIAIDAELAGGAAGLRAQQLAKLRAQLAPPAPAPKKIVIPSAEIDPLAYPEELERQAAAIAQAEKQLDAQRKSLDQQYTDLKLVAELRQAHDRTNELFERDNDQPHRGAPRASGGRGATASSDEASPAPQSGESGGGAGSGAGGGGDTTGTGGDSFGSDKHGASSFESTAAVALGEVIDRSTIDGMLRASRSGDPKQRAEAAKQARDAVAKRLEQLKKNRAMIELRAKRLRNQN